VVTALEHGAERIEAFAEPDQALTRVRELGANALAVGERNAHRIDGFALGNSLREYSKEAVQGKVLASTTTNGTRALLAAQHADFVLLGSYLNFGATAGALASLAARGMPVTILCAGNDGEEALEDSACAGAFVDWLVTAPLIAEQSLGTEAKRLRELWIQHDRRPENVFAAAPHAAVLRGAGYAQDLVDAAQLNTTAVIARAHGNVITVATTLAE